MQKVEIKDQANTIEVQHESGKITGEVVTQRQVEAKKITHSFDEVARNEQAKIDEIVRAPEAGDPGLKVPGAPSAKEAQISAVRIDALWDSYCLASPAASGCKKEQ